MSPYKEASNKGIAFCWSCTKNQLLEECGIIPTSRWNCIVNKYRYILFDEYLKETYPEFFK